MKRQEYAPEWFDIIRPQILARDNYTCSDCGIRHRSRVYKSSRGSYVVVDEFTEAWARANGKKVFTIYLNVAHLDQNKQNNNPSNLLSKCPRCHARFDANFRQFNRNLKRAEIKAQTTPQKAAGGVLNKEEFLTIREIIRNDTGVNISRLAAAELVNFFQIYFQNENK